MTKDYQPTQRKYQGVVNLAIKTSLVIGAIIFTILVLLFARKHHALSDKQLIQYHWKVYDAYETCKQDALVMQPSDLQKIDKEWKTSYRWIDNTVFLHIKDDAKFGNCVYIAK